MQRDHPAVVDSGKGLSDPLVEERAIVQARQRIMVRHVLDALLVAPLLGHVLVGRHPAAVGHRAARDGEGAAVAHLVNRSRCDGRRPHAVAQVFCGRRARIDALLDPPLQDVAQRGSGLHVVGGETVHLGVAIVAHDDALGLVEHAHALRHVAQDLVQAGGGEPSLASRDDSAEEHVAQPGRDQPHGHEERQQHEEDHGIVGGAGCDQRGRHRQTDAQDLACDQCSAGEVAPRHADQVGESQREAQQMHRGVVGAQERCEAPQAEHCDLGRRTGRVAQLPAQRRAMAAPADAGLVGLEVMGPDDGDDGNRQRADVEDGVRRLPRGHERARGRSHGADEQGGAVLVERLHDSRAHPRRQPLVLPIEQQQSAQEMHPARPRSGTRIAGQSEGTCARADCQGRAVNARSIPGSFRNKSQQQPLE